MTKVKNTTSIANTTPNEDAIAPKEYEEVKYWIEHHITTSMTIPQLEGCEALVEFFKKRKFKKDIPSQKEMDSMIEKLYNSIENKKDTLRQRKHREKKNGN